ncbi:RNA methyltransferase [Kocuria varians]|uniref:RNA methyltransferase n=1 Tax=Kocuria varians TaxID=1272 RepID=A0A4Y4D3A6_KOCVA|nr:RNA methyltransferase [Kocuria varians]GEC99661.1 RNA methyltransferase [Kocuria varians]
MTFVEGLEDRLLSNPRADRVRDVAALTRRSTRSKRGLFRAEGPQNVREAVRLALGDDDPARGLPELDAVYVTLEELGRHPEIAADLEALESRGGVFLRAVTPEVLCAMTDAVTPQGMLAVCRLPAGTTSPAPEAADLTCVLVRVQDPGNAGTVVRAADAAGAQLVAFTTGSVDPFNPKAVRSSAGSLFHVPVLTGVDLDALVSEARESGVTVLAADGRADTTVDALADEALLRRAGLDVPPAPVRLEAPTAWLFGNEAQGLDDHERGLADLAVAVPLHGRAESLNVGTAATVCLYASARAQRRDTLPMGTP